MKDEKLVEYSIFDGSKIKSFLVGNPSSKSVIIVIQEIWGLTNFIRNYSTKLASMGFLALAPHLYSRSEEN